MHGYKQTLLTLSTLSLNISLPLLLCPQNYFKRRTHLKDLVSHKQETSLNMFTDNAHYAVVILLV